MELSIANIIVLYPSYLILCSMIALSELAYCRLSVDSFSSLLGNVMDGEVLRGGAGGGVRKCAGWSRKSHHTLLQYRETALLWIGLSLICQHNCAMKAF